MGSAKSLESVQSSDNDLLIRCGLDLGGILTAAVDAIFHTCLIFMSKPWTSSDIYYKLDIEKTKQNIS